QRVDEWANVDFPRRRSQAFDPARRALEECSAALHKARHLARGDRQAVERMTRLCGEVCRDAPRGEESNPRRCLHAQALEDFVRIDLFGQLQFDYLAATDDAERQRQRKDDSRSRMESFAGTEGKSSAAKHALE